MARPVYPSDSADKTLVRFPDGMRDLLREEAKKNNRSLNAEIIARLDEYPQLKRGIDALSHENAELKIHLQHANEEVEKLKILLGGLRLELSTGNGMGGALGVALQEEARARAIDAIDDGLGVSASLPDAGAFNATLDQLKRIEEKLSRIEHMERLIEQIANEQKPQSNPTDSQGDK